METEKSVEVPNTRIHCNIISNSNIFQVPVEKEYASVLDTWISFPTSEFQRGAHVMSEVDATAYLAMNIGVGKHLQVVGERLMHEVQLYTVHQKGSYYDHYMQKIPWLNNVQIVPFEKLQVYMFNS